MFIVTDQATTSSEMDAKWRLLEPSALQARTALDKGEEDTAASVTRHLRTAASKRSKSAIKSYRTVLSCASAAVDALLFER